jgi:predicted Zn-dependent protease
MRFLLVTLGLLLVLAACGGQSSDVVAPRSDASPLAVMLASPQGPAVPDLVSGKPARARVELEGELAADPDGMAALNDLGVSYALEERFDAARQLLEEVLARGAAPEQQAALINLGELYAIDGYLGAALAHLASAKAIDPTRPEPSYALALLADARDDSAGSDAALRAAQDLDPTGSARRALIFLYPEERLHLEALLAESAGDRAGAATRWRELARGRFPTLAAAAQRHLEEP